MWPMVSRGQFPGFHNKKKTTKKQYYQEKTVLHYTYWTPFIVLFNHKCIYISLLATHIYVYECGDRNTITPFPFFFTYCSV